MRKLILLLFVLLLAAGIYLFKIDPNAQENYSLIKENLGPLNEYTQIISEKSSEMMDIIDSKISQEHRLMLAKYVPGLFSIDYVCQRKPHSGNAETVFPRTLITTDTNEELLCGSLQLSLSPKTKVKLLSQKNPSFLLLEGGLEIRLPNQEIQLETIDSVYHIKGIAPYNFLWFSAAGSKSLQTCVVGKIENTIQTKAKNGEFSPVNILGSATCEIKVVQDGISSSLLADEYIRLSHISKSGIARELLDSKTLPSQVDNKNKFYPPLLDTAIIGDPKTQTNTTLRWSSLREGMKNCELRKISQNTENPGKIIEFSAAQLSGDILIPSAYFAQNNMNLKCQVGAEQLYARRIKRVK